MAQTIPFHIYEVFGGLTFIENGQIAISTIFYFHIRSTRCVKLAEVDASVALDAAEDAEVDASFAELAAELADVLAAVADDAAEDAAVDATAAELTALDAAEEATPS